MIIINSSGLLHRPPHNQTTNFCYLSITVWLMSPDLKLTLIQTSNLEQSLPLCMSLTIPVFSRKVKFKVMWAHWTC